MGVPGKPGAMAMKTGVALIERFVVGRGLLAESSDGSGQENLHIRG